MIIGKIQVIPSSPNTLIYDERVVIDQGGRNASLDLKAEVQLATHGHMDHIAGLFKEAKKKFIPREDYWTLNLIGRRCMTYGFSSKDSGLFSYDLIKEELKAEFSDPEVEVIPLPGHTPGHSGFIIDNVLYVGDAFFGQKVLESFVFPFYVDFWKAQESLEKLAELIRGVDYVFLSHGPVYTDKRKVEEILKFNVEYNKKLVEKVKNAITGQELTAEEVVVKLGNKLSPANVFLNEVVAKSILVEVSKEVKVTEKGVVFKR
ncbi:MAG: MBL fold metallo-hydrolase [Candidatus Aramenus sp.]|jgi:glyoxylase-like metal-dependent hydrolase (beta-lactamase superfamily II)|nr:MBL fold metallo-hydrolase [Candidatus Aramenus sp.]